MDDGVSSRSRRKKASEERNIITDVVLGRERYCTVLYCMGWR